jgi:hypothetical protein
MKILRRNALPAAAGLLLLLAAVLAARHMRWDWHDFGRQMRSVSLLRMATGVACIYGTFILRAIRWSLFLKPRHSTSPAALVAPQFMGFAAVAIFGRLADLTRPALVALRTRTSLGEQLAVYSLSRVSDLATFVVLLTATLLFVPRSSPHHALLLRAGIVSATGLVAMAALVWALRKRGPQIAAVASARVRPLSQRAAGVLERRLLEAATALRSLHSATDALVVLALSLLIWLGIADAYVQGTRAFVLTPTLRALTFPQTLLLMVTSMSSSLLQVPVLGWFTQIALVSAALHAFFGAPAPEAAACAAVLLVITSLSTIPAGLIAARLSGITLAEAAQAVGRATNASETAISRV